MSIGLAGRCAGQAWSRRCFTLVELLAAMAVLVVMMFMLFRFIAGAQRAWSAANASQELYEKARVAMDLITRDLQSAVARANDVPGSDIKFQQVTGDALRFVADGVVGARGSNSPGSPSLLAEVGYHYDSAPDIMKFERALENSEPPATGWDIYQDRGMASEACVNQQNGFNEVIDGVLGLRFLCYDSTMAPRFPWNGTGLETGLPYAVDVQLRLIDTKSLARWRLLSTADRATFESEVALTFTKMIFLGSRQ